MAKGEIKYCELFTGWNADDGYYITGIIQFKYNPEYSFTDESLRVYYTTTPGQGNASYVNIVPPGSSSTVEYKLEADSWQDPYKTAANNYIEIAASSLINIATRAIKGLSNDYTTVRFTIPNLSANTTYYTRAWIRLFNSAGTKVKKTYKSPSVENERLVITTQYGDEEQPLFCVPRYEQIGSSDLYSLNWVDYTDCIKLPSYDVNSEDINEDWDDANYETHRIVTRKRISGKFEMIFPTFTRYKEFLNYLELSKQLNGSGIAYVELKVHVNNVLDTRADVNIANTRCINYIGKFFIKIDNNAWVQPIHGHYDKYSPLSITIQEA